ncbi:DUF2789 family protein [Candidatus Accumulibacter contiguus]|uniref:DUF2789 family protein n=1 Tax=Candidatus Accumulibacter contiguus TaxID=2954381 RepID=UPI0035675478
MPSSDYRLTRRQLTTSSLHTDPPGSGVALYRAPFWTATQRAFLKEEIMEAADWAGVIDERTFRTPVGPRQGIF